MLVLHFNGHFPGEPGLAGFIAAKDDGSVGDNWSEKLCKAPVKFSSPTNDHPARCPSCCPTNSVRALLLYNDVHGLKVPIPILIV